MHYIRLLKSPTQSRSGKRHMLDLVFTITTDLGDSFLYADEPINLAIYAEIPSDSDPQKKDLVGFSRGTENLQWRSGMRVAKPSVDISSLMQQTSNSRRKVAICISADGYSARTVSDILATTVVSQEEEPAGQIMPVWITLDPSEGEVEISTRRLYLPGTSGQEDYVELEEEIGESIARHIWDAGVIAFCAITESWMLLMPTDTEPSLLKALKTPFAGPKPINVLELGCGVGILGGGLSAVLPRMRPPPSRRCTFLMTDLEEAESRARSNMSRLLQVRKAKSSSSCSPVKLLYENLDWEDGRKGEFGPETQSHRWDLIMLSDCTYNVDMLPALVETLSALHASNMTHAAAGEQPRSTKVLLATKPRHASEEALFELLSREGWAELHQLTLPLPVLGAETQSVELYMYEKLE
ncbi:putative methyltransferase domain-containing protein [Trichoderma austrokoningii]